MALISLIFWIIVIFIVVMGIQDFSFDSNRKRIEKKKLEEEYRHFHVDDKTYSKNITTNSTSHDSHPIIQQDRHIADFENRSKKN